MREKINQDNIGKLHLIKMKSKHRNKRIYKYEVAILYESKDGVNKYKFKNRIARYLLEDLEWWKVLDNKTIDYIEKNI